MSNMHDVMLCILLRLCYVIIEVAAPEQLCIKRHIDLCCMYLEQIEYVPGTEDVQFCRGWNSASANRISSKAIRQQKFFDWVEQRTNQWSVMSVQTNTPRNQSIH